MGQKVIAQFGDFVLYTNGLDQFYVRCGSESAVGHPVSLGDAMIILLLNGLVYEASKK